MEFAAAAMQSLAGLFGAGASASAAGATAAGSAGTVGSLLAAGSSMGTLTIGGLEVGSAAAALGSASTFASILSGTATVASALAAQRAAKDQALNLEFQAQDAEFEGRQEMVAGMERRNSLRKALISAIAEQDTAYAASGVDLSFGTPAVARRQASEEAERALEIDQATEEMRRGRFLEKAGNLRTMAARARRGGLAKSAGLFLDGAAQAIRRG